MSEREFPTSPEEWKAASNEDFRRWSREVDEEREQLEAFGREIDRERAQLREDFQELCATFPWPALAIAAALLALVLAIDR